MATDAHDADVIDFLLDQHGQIHELFGHVLMCPPGERQEGFDRLVRLLAVHETAEEEIVHPLARRVLSGGEGIVDDRLEEERQAKEILASLEAMGVDDPAFLDTLDALRLSVLTHARAEERYEFPRLRDSFSKTQHVALLAAVKAAESTAPTHPHPGTESATKNLALGPMAAIADRVRDAIKSMK
ncbi:hemerythrin domain-containing protein [Actinocorallia aurea]